MLTLDVFVPQGEDGPLPALGALAVLRSPAPDDWEVLYPRDPKWWGGSPALAPAKIQLPRDPAKLPAALDRELSAAFVADGWSGVDRFAAGVFGLDAYTRLFLRGPQERDAAGAGGSRQMAILRANVSPDRKDLWAAFEPRVDALIARAADMRSRIQTAALQRAVHVELPAARDDILREARRYLSLREDSDEVAREVLESGSASAHTQLLLGPDGQALTAALVALQPALRRMQEASADYTKLSGIEKVGDVNRATVLLNPWTGLPALAMTELARPDDATVASSAKYLAQTSADFTAQFSSATIRYPLLFRLWDASPAVDSGLALTATQTLQGAWEASQKLASNLQSNPALVWKLPTLIDRTVQFGFDPQSDYAPRIADDAPLTDRQRWSFDAETDFAQRVAGNVLAEVNGEVTPIQFMNYVIQGLDTAFMLVPLPQIRVPLLVLSVFAQTAELVESYINSEEQRLASAAAIDPSRALSSAPSYLSLIVQAAFVALCVIPVPHAAGEFKAWLKLARG